MTSRDYKFLLLIFLTMLTVSLIACGEDTKHWEYEINGEWKRCNLMETAPCGQTLICGSDEVYQCMTNVATRAR